MHLFDPFRLGRIGFVLLASLGVVINAVTLPNDLSSRATSDPTILTFKSEVHTDVSLRFVRNSGVCETTPGVNQLSGYIDFGTNMSMVRALKPVIMTASEASIVVLVFRGKRKA